MRSWLIALALVVVVAAVAAHEKFKIVGTVTALKKDEIAVKAIDGATYEIDFLDTAVVTDKNHKTLDRATLTVGEKVIVLALGHDMFDLEAFEVQLTDRQAPAASPVQYRSPAGVQYRSLPDTDAVRTARAALEADPKNIAKIIDLGVAQSGARQFREAIATFTRGLAIEPDNALLLRWRGHRYLSVREFDRAFADLSRGSTIDPTIYGNWYHLGVVQFLRGDFADAAASFAKAQPIAPDPGELAGSTDWLWMSLSRAGRGAEASSMLNRMLDRRPEKPVTNAYTRRLQLYRGEIGPDAVLTAADTDEVQIATLAYGLGNWYLVKGDKAQARKWFERSVQASGGWPGFGFIVSEAELRRLR